MEFKTIENYPDYQISKDGVVISLKTQKILKQSTHTRGYKQIKLNNKNIFVHRLVAITYLDNPLNLPQVNHKDGNKKNNNVDNLEWVTNSQNRNHAIKLGLIKVEGFSGSSNPNSKLNELDVIEIKKLLQNSISVKEIATKYNVSPGAIHDIKSGRNWKNI